MFTLACFLTGKFTNGGLNRFMMASSIISGPPTDENVASLVGRIVADLQSSMLNLHLQKAAQVYKKSIMLFLIHIICLYYNHNQ